MRLIATLLLTLLVAGCGTLQQGPAPEKTDIPGAG